MEFVSGGAGSSGQPVDVPMLTDLVVEGTQGQLILLAVVSTGSPVVDVMDLDSLAFGTFGCAAAVAVALEDPTLDRLDTLFHRRSGQVTDPHEAEPIGDRMENRARGRLQHFEAVERIPFYSRAIALLLDRPVLILDRCHEYEQLVQRVVLEE